MRKCYFTFLAFAFPIAAMAQITNAENYLPGDEIHNMSCSVPASAGGSGTGQNWDFSAVVDSTQVTTYVFADSANPGDIILAPAPTPVGNPVHKTSTQNLTTSINVAIGTIDYTPGLLLAERSFNFGSTDNVAFTVSGLPTGSGSVSFNCDGSGSLTTPAGTFPNAYRVRMVHDEVDSVVLFTTSTINTHNISYVWYDDAHVAPLFRIDSNNVAADGSLAAFSDTSASAEYLQAVFPAAVNTVAATQSVASAHLNSSSLSINASLQNGAPYELVLFNVSGQKVYTTSFVASSSSQHFNINTTLAAGTYFVNIYKKNSHGAPIIIKTTKE